MLATVDITTRVRAGGNPLPAGTYELRLTSERQTPPPGGPAADAQQYVEFVREGKVVARDIAEVLRDDDLPAIGLSSRPVASGTRVELLRGAEFPRVPSVIPANALLTAEVTVLEARGPSR